MPEDGEGDKASKEARGRVYEASDDGIPADQEVNELTTL